MFESDGAQHRPTRVSYDDFKNSGRRATYKDTAQL